MTKESYFQKFGDIQMMSEFEDDNIRLTFLSGVSGYKCNITSTQLMKAQQRLAGKFDNVAEMARTTFKKAEEHKFSLTIEEKDGSDNNEKVLVWRKIGGKAKLRLASFDVESVNLSLVLDTIFNFLNKDRYTLQSRLEETENELTEVKVELERLSKIVEDLNKASTEDELIAQFLPLLNSKKRRIAQLEQELANALGTREEEADDPYNVSVDSDQDNSSDHQDQGEGSYQDDTDVEQDDNNEENNVSEDSQMREVDKNDLKRRNNVAYQRGEPEKRARLKETRSDSFGDDLFNDF